MLKKAFPVIITITVISIAILFTDSICLTKAVTGFPCPGCGLTRANLSFFRGNFSQALNFHPLFLVVDAYLIYIVIYALKSNTRESKTVKILTVIFAVSLLGVFIYRVRLLYPNIEPLTYNYNSLFYKIKQIFYN